MSGISTKPAAARSALRNTLVVLVLFLAWAAASQWGVPRLLRAAAAGAEIPIVTQLLSAGYPVEEYVDRWSVLSVTITAIAFIALSAFFGRRWLAKTLGASPTMGAPALLLLAISCGIISGLVEALLPVARGGVPFETALVTGLLWMPPAGAAIAFAFIAAIVWLASHAIWQGNLSVRGASALFAGLALFGIIRAAASGIHPAAAALLAAGIAWQAGRFVAGPESGRPRRFGIATAGLAALVLLFGVGGALYERQMERNAVAALPAAREGATNVVLLILDTVRAKSLSLYGHARGTSPQLERLAARGVTFDLAVATAPWTLPSHASVFTGRWPHQLSADRALPLDNTHRTLAEALAGQGYRTGGFVGNVWYASRPHGIGRGFHHYEDYQSNLSTVFGFHRLARGLVTRLVTVVAPPPELGRVDAKDVNARFLRWLDRGADRPFFAFLNYFDAHHPYETRDPFWRPYSPHRPRHWIYTGPGKRYTEPELEELRNAYDATIAYVDHQVGALLDALERRGLLDNTLVIVTSDHGELLGEHGLINHGNALYMPLLHVPLVLSLPSRIPGGLRAGTPASLRDIPATVTDLLGVDAAFPGASLRRHWEGGAQTDGPLLSELEYHPRAGVVGPVTRGSMKSLLDGSRHYIRNGDGVEELYDLSSDPDEMNDLSRTTAGAAELADFRQMLEAASRTREAGARVARPAGTR